MRRTVRPDFKMMWVERVFGFTRDEIIAAAYAFGEAGQHIAKVYILRTYVSRLTLNGMQIVMDPINAEGSIVLTNVRRTTTTN